MRSLLLFYIFILGYAAVSESQDLIDPEVRFKIDSFISNLMVEKHIPGFGLSIIKDNGSLIYARGYGFANLEEQIPADHTTLFGIGSITKSFTASMVVQKLSQIFPQLGPQVLNTPIRELAPAYNLTLIDRYRSERTTFKDLLSHRVCTLPEGVGSLLMTYTDQADLIYRHRYSPAVCEFRDNFVYNNGLIMIAGDIVAHMVNSTYDEMLRDFLDELGMIETTWVKMDDDHANMPGRSQPYIWKDGEYLSYNPELLKVVNSENAAGGILSSPTDMLKYLNFHLNLGKVGDRQVVPEEAMQWLRGVYNPLGTGIAKTEENPTARIDAVAGYGLCLEVGLYDGWLRISHGGYLPPYESVLTFYPDLNLGIFTTINGPGTQRHTSYSLQQVNSQIFDYVEGISRMEEIKTKAHVPITPSGPFSLGMKPTHPIQETRPPLLGHTRITPEEAVGTFGNGFHGEMTIRLEAGEPRPYFECGIWGRGWLEQVSNTTFNIVWDSDFWQLGWTYGMGMPNNSFVFLDSDTLQLFDEGMPSSLEFIRGQRLDDLPEIPWAPESC